jgi:O-antigen/teichoic acid export membrane protein
LPTFERGQPQPHEGSAALARLKWNTISGLVQALLSTGTIFFVYRYVIETVGLVDLGVWALVGGAATAGSLGTLGLGAASVKFTAKHLASRQSAKANEAIVTAFFAVAASVGLIALLALWGLPSLLALAIEGRAETLLALDLLPWALLAFWFNAVGGVLLGGLDGWNRMDLRAVVVVLATAAYALVAVVCLPRVGIIGLVQGQIAQGIVVMVAAWITLVRLSPSHSLLPRAFSFNALREMLTYGATFQVISVLQMLVEPAAKFLLTTWGGLALTGVFELANRLAFQVRSLLNSAYHPLFPLVADLHESDPDAIRDIYARAFQVVVFTVSVLFPAVLLMLPLISVAWLGWFEPSFVLFAAVLCAAWFGNLAGTPAYYANAGTGDLRWNVVGHLLTAALLPLLAWTLGPALQGHGVVYGFAFALLAGSLTIVAHFHVAHGIRLTDLLGRHDLVGAALSGGAVTALVLLSTRELPQGPALWEMLVLAVAGLCILAIWALRHPQGQWLLSHSPLLSRKDSA